MLLLNPAHLAAFFFGLRISLLIQWIVNFNTIPYSSNVCLRITSLCYRLNIGQDRFNVTLTM